MTGKILIVDDEEILRKIYSDRLTFEGFNIDTATDGEEALLKIKSFAPNLILLDILMPKLNGIQVLEQINTDPSLKSIPVIVLSNVASDDNIKKALELGAKDYLLKTNFSPNEIISKITSLMTAQTSTPGEITYKIMPRDSMGDVIKLSQDFPFLNYYKCPNCGGNVVFSFKSGANPDAHDFVARAVCETCKKVL